VFLYQQNLPRRVVAVKVLLNPITDDETARALAAEADVMAGLSAHPAILTVFEVSVAPDGRPYLVMEYCPTSMATRYRSETIPMDEVLSVGVRVAGAVESAHRVGMLHRDIKPSNILLTSYGHPVLSDFGVATATVTGDEDTIAMSPPWSAPEVVDRRSSGTVATEVWALAATVYTLAAGHAPFDIPGGRRSDEQLRARIMRAKYNPTGRQDAPEGLDAVLEHGLKRLAADRYASAREFGEALQEVQRAAGLPVTGLDLPGAEWEPISVSGPQQEGPRRSTVAVDSKRSRSSSTTVPRDASATSSRTSHGVSMGRRIAIGAIIAGAALAGVVIAAALVLGR
jgi:serine/threonine protein kinase